jgi:hypothetical protein
MPLLTKVSTSLVGCRSSIARAEPDSIAFWNWQLKRYQRNGGLEIGFEVSYYKYTNKLLKRLYLRTPSGLGGGNTTGPSQIRSI